MKPDIDLYNQIIDFISQKYWVPKGGFRRDTRISDDLGLEGDDADEFMQTFSQKFDVDLSGFNFEKYFIVEGFNPIGIIRLFWKLRRKSLPNKSKHSLTIGDLEKSAQLGKWVDPE